jgi:hypothetical protein
MASPLYSAILGIGKDSGFDSISSTYTKKKIFYSFIHMCIHCLGHFSFLPPNPILCPPPPSLPGRTCSSLISNFLKRRHKHNKKDKVFLPAELRIAVQGNS